MLRGAGMPVFDRLRYRRDDRHVFLYAFDLLQVDSRDLRREPIEDRKGRAAKLLRRAKPGLQLNEHISEPGDIVFRHACKLGLEGIVSKRLGSPYKSGRSHDWLKFKNPQAPAVKREHPRCGGLLPDWRVRHPFGRKQREAPGSATTRVHHAARRRGGGWPIVGARNNQRCR